MLGAGAAAASNASAWTRSADPRRAEDGRLGVPPPPSVPPTPPPQRPPLLPRALPVSLPGARSPRAPRATPPLAPAPTTYAPLPPPGCQPPATRRHQRRVEGRVGRARGGGAARGAWGGGARRFALDARPSLGGAKFRGLGIFPPFTCFFFLLLLLQWL